jgi:hypothetical protein
MRRYKSRRVEYSRREPPQDSSHRRCLLCFRSEPGLTLDSAGRCELCQRYMRDRDKPSRESLRQLSPEEYLRLREKEDEQDTETWKYDAPSWAPWEDD